MSLRSRERFCKSCVNLAYHLALLASLLINVPFYCYNDFFKTWEDSSILWVIILLVRALFFEFIFYQNWYDIWDRLQISLLMMISGEMRVYSLKNSLNIRRGIWRWSLKNSTDDFYFMLYFITLSRNMAWLDHASKLFNLLTICTRCSGMHL